MSFPEQDRAVQILEKEFGPRWKQIVQELGTKELRQRVGKELTSFMAFPERGSGGNNKWRGNCSPEVVRAILRYVLECKHYYGKQTQDFMRVGQMEAFIVKGQYNCVSDTRSYQNGWPKITSGPGATRVIWCSLHLTRTAPWQK